MANSSLILTGDEVVKRPFALLLVLFLVLYFIYGLKKRVKRKDKSKSRDIPSIRHFPFWVPELIEGLMTLYKVHKDGIHFIDWMRNSLNSSDVIRIPFPFGSKLVFVMNPNQIPKFLGTSDPKFLHKPAHSKLVFSELLKDGLLAGDYGVWKVHRKILNKYFTYNKFPSHLKVINKHSQLILNKLDECGLEQLHESQLSSVLYNQILNIIFEILFGDGKGIDKIPEMFKEMKEIAFGRLRNPLNLLEFVWKLNPKRKLFLDGMSYINCFIDDGIRETEKAVAKKEAEYNDNSASDPVETCVEYLLKSKMSFKEIRDEIATFFVAGHETTETTLHFLLQHLGEHLTIQEKCQEEIDFVFSSKSEGDTEITMDNLANLKYLEQCILESLRLTPTIPMIGRQLPEKVELGNTIFEAGTILFFSPWALHKHPNYYPEAEKFDPERFTLENVKERHPYAFLPFSTGPRKCIGWKLAMMQLKTLMAWILRNYSVHSKDKLSQVKLLANITLLPEKRFDFVLKKRKISSEK